MPDCSASWSNVIILIACPYVLLTLRVVKQHQALQQQIDTLRAQVAAEDKRIHEAVQLLVKAEESLEHVLVAAEAKLAAIHKAAAAGAVATEDVLAYARLISYTTSAPPAWVEGQPFDPFKPPAPTDLMIKSSLLYEAHEAAKRPSSSSSAGAAAAATAAAAAALTTSTAKDKTAHHEPLNISAQEFKLPFGTSGSAGGDDNSGVVVIALPTTSATAIAANSAAAAAAALAAAARGGDDHMMLIDSTSTLTSSSYADQASNTATDASILNTGLGYNPQHVAALAAANLAANDVDFDTNPLLDLDLN